MINNFSVVITKEIHNDLKYHLLRYPYQEDLCFGLYNKSVGDSRLTGIVCEIILPHSGERILSGNVIFTSDYFERVIRLAIQNDKGIVFFHSHPWPGWQEMSEDDEVAEQKMSISAWGAIGRPLLGVTMGSDGACSARFWIKDHLVKRKFNKSWCKNVRVIGKELEITFNDNMFTSKIDHEKQKRTISAWGIKTQQNLSKLKVGIVGLGSVGSIVAENLSRIGFTDIVLIDFDKIELKNFDRMVNVFSDDVGHRKTEIIRHAIMKSSSSSHINVDPSNESICEYSGFQKALDCDVLFSCVDRPWPRHVLNFIAYAHLIPVIDGGIRVRTNKNNTKIIGADWKTQVVGYQRPCLECLGQYKLKDAALERDGYLDDPSYIKGMKKNDIIDASENVFVFSSNLASLEVLQLLSLFISPSGVSNLGQQVFHFVSGTMDNETSKHCHPNCYFQKIVGVGDSSRLEVCGTHKRAHND